MNAVTFPAACTVHTPLPGGGMARIVAEAHALGSRPLDLERIGIRLDRAVWQHIMTTVATVRELADSASPDFAAKLTLYGPEDADIHAPQVLDAITLAAIVADQALLARWEEGDLLTLGRCLVDDAGPRLVPLPEDGQRKGLRVLNDLPALPRATWLCAAPAAPEEGVLHQAILASHPTLLEGQWSEIFRTNEVASRSVSLFFPTVDLAAPTPDNDLLLTLKIRIAAVNRENEAKTEIRGATQQQAAHIESLLTTFRNRDNPRGQHYQTRISLPEEPFTGNSFELALLLADRIARGREFPMPHGSRLIATGSLSRDETLAETARSGSFGSVLLPTDTLTRKCALLERETRRGDRILVPGNWQSEPALVGTRTTLRNRGASLATVGSLLSSPSLRTSSPS